MANTITHTFTEEQLAQLRKLAEQYDPYDDLEEDEYFDPQDHYGGNFDDAFSGGMQAGEAFAARLVLSMIEGH